MSRVPYLIDDTTDFINRKKDLNNLPASCMVVLLGVVGLYPLLLYEEGMRSATRELRTENFVELANTILKKI